MHVNTGANIQLCVVQRGTRELNSTKYQLGTIKNKQMKIVHVPYHCINVDSSKHDLVKKNESGIETKERNKHRINKLTFFILSYSASKLVGEVL